MSNGMDYWVWYDDEPMRTLKLKIEQAIGRYKEKYYELPKECNFNQQMVTRPGNPDGNLSLEQVQFPGVEVSLTGNIPINNFWLGPIPVVTVK